jgi:hypothetical protein
MTMEFGKVISLTSLTIWAIIIIVGGVGFQLVTTQPGFCNFCHEMNFYYNSWQNSTHGPKSICVNCHSEPGLRGFIGEKVRGAEQVVAHFSGNYPVPIKIITRVKNDQCLACHPETLNLTDKTIEAKHLLHMDKSVLCADCHNRLVHNQSGQPRVMTIDQCDSCHKAHNNFKLLGVHATLSCEKCHPRDKYNGTKPNCEYCHKVPANHTGIAGNCDKCHSATGWKPATFDHSKFPLTGKHQSLTCEQCHHGNYNVTKALCENCHNLPANHITGITGNCDKCHTTAGWKPATFDHSKFPLTGKHQSLSCEQCHKGKFTGTAARCVNCHNPPLSHDGMDTDCSLCHSPDSFAPANFVHNRVGEHMGRRSERPLSCDTCHPVRFIENSCTGSRCHNSNGPRGDD